MPVCTPSRKKKKELLHGFVNERTVKRLDLPNNCEPPHRKLEKASMIEYYCNGVGKPPATMVWVRVPQDHEVELPLQREAVHRLREHTADAIVRLSSNILVATCPGRHELKDRRISRAWYGVDEQRGIDCTQKVQQLVAYGCAKIK